MGIRQWRPRPQLTATVRLTALAAGRLGDWLDAQPLPPRTANEALNAALESLGHASASDDLAIARTRCRTVMDELDMLMERVRQLQAAIPETPSIPSAR
ncbi:MAG: hypothetical protein ABF665_05035 [Gluconacetobacter sp.]